MLFWLKFFTTCLIISFLTLNLNSFNFLSLIILSEFNVVLIFFIYLFNGIVFNIYWLAGFSFLIIILGGLEMALSFMVLTL